MNFNNIKKYVISLKRREDRREYISQEMRYMEWEFNFFDAIDTNSYEGCALSHKEIAKLLLDSKEDYIMVFEDDTFFMPYARDLINKITNEINNIDLDFFTLAPSVNRPLTCTKDSLLVSLNNLPPKDNNIHRGIFGTSGLLYNKKIAQIIAAWDTNKYIENYHKQKPIDEYIDLAVLPFCNSYCARYPISTQRNNFSDINYTLDNNHYKIMYNWRHYGYNMPNLFDKQDYCTDLKGDNKHYDISICDL